MLLISSARLRNPSPIAPEIDPQKFSSMKILLSLTDLSLLSEIFFEDELNALIFEAIREGRLSLPVFLQYQGITQSDISESLYENIVLDSNEA